jgi:hypothetical protein
LNSIEELVRRELAQTIGSGDYQLPKYLDGPVELGEEQWISILGRQHLIARFLATVSSIGRTAILERDASLTSLLFSEVIGGMTPDWHGELPESCWKPPVFYRTDQSLSGLIYEIQSPGSGWGDIPLLERAYSSLGHNLPPLVTEFTTKYAAVIASETNVGTPKVLHMLDAASAPAPMRYLHARTRPMLQYWGLDRGLSMYSVDFVTAHSAASLVTANAFSLYLRQVTAGTLRFGLPPNLLFDQKVIYALPFHRRTRCLFSDEIRELFPFTTVVEEDGFFDKNDNFIPLEDFDKWARDTGVHYLKYGGPELEINWGSRGVLRLSKGGHLEHLKEAGRLARNRGQVWLIQEDVSRRVPASLSDSLGRILETGDHVKLSAFYGPSVALGAKVMARRHFKVHGQGDTQLGLGV